MRPIKKIKKENKGKKKRKVKEIRKVKQKEGKGQFLAQTGNEWEKGSEKRERKGKRGFSLLSKINRN